MKKYLIIILLLTGSISLKAQVEKVNILTSAVCGMCKNNIERDLAFEKGIKTANLDLDTKVITVEYNAKKTDADKIRQRISKVGYHADSVKRNKKAYDALDPCCKDGAHQDDH